MFFIHLGVHLGQKYFHYSSQVKRNTVLIIEHYLDVIKQVDHIIEICPEGGKYGGELIGCGSPEEISKLKNSHTGQFLFEELKTL